MSTLPISPLAPLADHVVLRPIDETGTTASGLVIPEAHREAPSTGEVLACGPRVTGVRAGQRVVYGKYQGTEVAVGGATVLILQERDLLAVVPESAP